MINDTSVDKLEVASRRILVLQQELREMQKKPNEELIGLKVALQEAQKIAAAAEQKIKKAEESARNSKERAKRLKRKIEKLMEISK